ncbi:MAG TPA: BatD family protein [Pseudomonadales bacterium]|nr:BatD family protein [Pseudomonadales bacterium]
MVKTSICRVFLIVLLMVASVVVQASTFSAQLNRDVLEEGETVELELKIDESSILSQPDFSVLEKDFDIIDQSRSSQLQIINGDSQSSTVWKLTLQPKSTGKLTIPAISLNNLATQPMTLTVNKVADSSVQRLQTLAPIMVEAVLDKNQVYVQEQVVLSVRLLYQGLQISQWALSEPDIDGAVVHELGTATQYEKKIGTASYGVLERRYALFPQKSGSLTVKPIVFQGIVHQGSGQYFLGRGQKIQENSQALSLNVKPQDPGFSYPVWLPAQALTLEERWSSAPASLKVGDSLTRSITIKAIGQNSTSIPPVELHLPEGIKAYPDKANLDETVSKEGLIGQRVENIAIIPTQAGQFVLPALEIPWWDTVNQKVQIARLPARTLTVKAEENNQSASPTLVPEAKPAKKIETLPEQNINPSLQSELKKWQYLTFILIALLCLITLAFFVYFLKNRKKSAKEVNQVGQQKINEPSQLADAYKQLLSACEKNDLKSIQAALLQWGSCYCGKTIHSLEELARCLGNNAIAVELQALEKSLYGRQDTQARWQANSLVALIKTLPSSTEKKQVSDKALKKLYPDM